MAKSKKLKKRRMRQLHKRIKQSSKVTPALEIVKPIILTDDEKPWLNPVIIESEPPKELKAHLLYEGKYNVENEAYQQQLDAVYGGSVVAVEKFINERATILHHCHECKSKWYSKPKLLLTKDDQEHVCGASMRPTANTANQGKKRRRLTDQDKLKIYMLAEQGMSQSKIADRLQVSRPTVSNVLKQKKGLG